MSKVCSECKVPNGTLNSRDICSDCLETFEINEELQMEEWIYEELPVLTGTKPKPQPFYIH